MKLNTLRFLEVRDCPRGYSIGLFVDYSKTVRQAYKVYLFLDSVPYWLYQNLCEYDAMQAMDDLELAPGPRGDSSWKAVLDRVMLNSQSEPYQTRTIMRKQDKTSIGTWEWVQNLRLTRAGQITT